MDRLVAFKDNRNIFKNRAMLSQKILELAFYLHLEEKNHSKRFWNKIKIMLPDYERYKEWLKENRHLLGI